MRLSRIFLLVFTGIFFTGCTAQAPKLEDMQPTTKSSSRYVSALQDINTILEVYLPPDFGTRFYHVKSIRDYTGVSKTTEIPLDITPLVRDALSQIHYKIRHVELYDQEDATHSGVENVLAHTNRLNLNIIAGERRTPHFTIVGSISQFDRNLSSTSNSRTAQGSVGGGTGQADISASNSDAASLSRLGVSFSVYDRHGVSCPGKFGATVDVAYAKNGMDIGFAIYGAGIGFGTEATAMHGRHQALQMLAELSIIQIIGRTMTIPYWRAGAELNIFEEDPIVIDNMRLEYQATINDGMIIPFTQLQCIANGDDTVKVTGILDKATMDSLAYFANKYNVHNRSFPNFELYKELENNRLLDTNVAARAWAAYSAYKNGGAAPTPSVQTSVEAPAPGTRPSRDAQPARPAEPSLHRSSDYEDVLEDLL